MNSLLILILLTLCQAQIYYDGGNYNGFDSNACDAGQSQIQTINFSGTFQTPPQIIHSLRMFSLYFTGSPNQSQVKVEFVSITTTSFDLKVSCPKTTGACSRYHIYWYAFSVPRSTVIISDIVASPQNGEIYPHPHTNTLATQGFVSLMSLEYSGVFEFSLDVYSVTSTEVKVKFTSSNTNAYNIGYFVIIGPDNAFTKTLQQQPGSYTSSSLTIPTDGNLFISMSGLGWTSMQPRMSSNIVLTPPTASYSYGTFAGTVLSQITFYEVWFINRIIYPMYIRKYRVTQMSALDLDYQIKVIFNGQTYTAVGSYVQNIPAASLSVVATINMQFYPNTILQGTISRCTNCGSNFYDRIKKYYQNANNLITFNFEFKQYSSYNIKDFIITITSTGVMIKQMATVTDDKATLVNLQFS